MMPGGAEGYDGACSIEFLRGILAFDDVDFAGDPKKPDVLFLRVFCPVRLPVLLCLLLALIFEGFAGVTGGDARLDDGSSCWPLPALRASISSRDKFTLVLPFSFARAILSNAVCKSKSCLSLTGA